MLMEQILSLSRNLRVQKISLFKCIQPFRYQDVMEAAAKAYMGYSGPYFYDYTRCKMNYRIDIIRMNSRFERTHCGVYRSTWSYFELQIHRTVHVSYSLQVG